MRRFHLYLAFALPLSIGISFSLCLRPLQTTVQAQATSLDSATVLRQLLALPAPTPRSADAIPDAEQLTKQRPPQFFDEHRPPPDDAPVGNLLEYWNRWADTSARAAPSDVVKGRLLDACLADPEILHRFLRLLPQTAATAAKVKELYDKQEINQESDNGWRENVRRWLLFNSKYFLSELLAQANKVRDDDKGGYVDKEEALIALARVDWETAEPLLNSLLLRGQPRTRALALTLFYRHVIDEKDPGAEDRYRVELKTIAADRNAPSTARDFAIDALSLSEWSGRDEWYLSLFHDETLIDPSDGSRGFSPLTTLFVRDPDKWIPVLAQMMESENKTVRSAAATCLITFQNQNARKDALTPLLPWLSNPGWAKDRVGHRLRLIQSMENLDLPESVPGLIWAVEHDDSESSFERSYAAQSLARYKDPRAVPALRKALNAEKDDDHRRRFIHGLLSCEGLTETEQLEALEAYASKLTTPEGREEVSRYRSYGDVPLAIPLSIGSYLSRMQKVQASVVRAVLARAAVLQRSNPALAQSLLEVTHRWQGRQIDLDLIQRIAAGTADAPTIVNALERRAKLRESVEPELQTLIGGTGLAPGLAAVLLDDGSLAQSVLSSGSETAKEGLLACARLTRMPLPVESVGALLQSRNQLLASAAEAYLMVEDSKAAQELLWARHPGEAFITGWRANIQTDGDSNFDPMEDAEKRLKAELFGENNPQEIFALVGESEHYSRVLRVYKNKAVFTHYGDPARYRERVISNAELETFKNFITTNHLADLGPQFSYCHHNCWSSELLLLTKEKGRRVFSHQGFGSWMTVVPNFDHLGRGEGGKTHYAFEKDIKGLEILYEDDKLLVKDVWQRGADIRILVERQESSGEIERGNQPNRVDDEDDAAARAERRRQEIVRQKLRFSWRAFANNRVGEQTAPPSGYLTFDESKFPPDDEDESEGSLSESQTQLISLSSIVIAQNFDGLWRQAVGQKAVRISGEGGAYANPIVTPDGKWVVVSKTDSDWSKPNYIVRFNLETGREYRVGVPPADQFDPEAYLALHGRILLRRAKDDDRLSPTNSVGPETIEYYLLDAATGQAQLVRGVFAPLLQEGKRFLQPAGNSNEFWAAIPDREKNETQVGRYNLKEFSFKPLMTVKHISFESMAMWIDEGAGKLYLVYNGQLLRFPLQSK